jgi:hypothetical protein
VITVQARVIEMLAAENARLAGQVDAGRRRRGLPQLNVYERRPTRA